MMDTDLKPVDILDARLEQARGVLAAIASTYDNQDEAFSLTPRTLNAALWGLETLLSQADAARDAMARDLAGR